LKSLAALLLVFATSAVAEDGLGRLFFSPSDRTRLDAQRAEAIANSNRPKPVVTEAPAVVAPSPRTVTLNGIVRRPDGEATVWINGKAIDAVAKGSPVQPGSLGRAEAGVRLPESRNAVRLKVGQSIETGSGVVEEPYLRRRTAPEIQEGDEPPGADDALAPRGRSR
jgi:hypothetical protein